MLFGVQSSVLTDFERRGLIADMTAADELDAHLSSGARTAYVGFDPTADSLHVGSLLPLLALRRLQLAGHRPIVLVGGGTGLIGDPSGKAGERALNPKDRVAEWAERLKAQVRPFLDFDRGPQAALLVDNYSWLSQLDLIGFLRDIGKHFPVGAMLARESVKARMGAGISYTEFSYQVLQAYDFMSLSLLHDCTLQLGGSDQWGNITAGVELIRRVHARAAYGLTLPLVTKSDGSKFGKTESGTIWLDPRRTSAYEMYQFWLNTPDANAGRFLRYFTFLSHERIAELEKVTETAPDKREAQRALAREATALLHGEAGVREAEAISAALFSGDVASLPEPQLTQAARGMPTSQLRTRDLADLSWPDLLVRVGLADSKRNARELLNSGAVQVNGRRLDAGARAPSGSTLFDKYLILRKGKKTYHAVELGEDFPASA
ncbi:MAG TPA: tyrosine--tRNA ligase [Methylomirabilota bacterium]|jgi:tyrosyl-tRNA synthetase